MTGNIVRFLLRFNINRLSVLPHCCSAVTAGLGAAGEYAVIETADNLTAAHVKTVRYHFCLMAATAQSLRHAGWGFGLDLYPLSADPQIGRAHV